MGTTIMNTQIDMLGEVSIDCLICLKNMMNLVEVEKHSKEEGHRVLQKAKKKICPQFKTFRCLLCELDVGSKEIRRHLLIAHFKIHSDFLHSKIRSHFEFFECFCCKRKVKFKQYTDHLESKEHLRKLESSAMQYYLGCNLCNVLFESISELQQHSRTKNHEKRIKILKYHF